MKFGSLDISQHYVGSSVVPRIYNCEDTSYIRNETAFDANVLIVGGGGGGGTALGGGGGGAGGYREFTKKYYTGTSYTVTVGAGGSASSVGGNSSIERIGSGGGAGGTTTGGNGGSGGGGNGFFSNAGGSSTSPRCNGSAQGNAGDSGNGIGAQGGGGGGANAAGSGAGNGGNGTASSITGSSVTRAGGGGGGDTTGGSGGSAAPGSGGSGGGGDGGSGNRTNDSAAAAGDNGTANTGGGGGGGAYYHDPSTGFNLNGTGGNGGSGFVCIKFPDTITITIGGGLTYTSSTSGGYTTVQFTAGTDTISFHNDQYWNNTVLILQDSFTDESPQALTLTVGTGVRLSSTSKVGSQSIEAFGDGTATRMSLPTDSSLDIGTSNDFTFEFWMKNNSTDAYAVWLSSVFGVRTGTVAVNSGFTGGKLFFIYATGTGNHLASTTTVQDNNWHHVAVTRSSGYLRLFIDGTIEDFDATNSANITWSGNTFFDSLQNALSDNEGKGFLDALRITSGVARYTSNFTPSTQRYT